MGHTRTFPRYFKIDRAAKTGDGRRIRYVRIDDAKQAAQIEAEHVGLDEFEPGASAGWEMPAIPSAAWSFQERYQVC